MRILINTIFLNITSHFGRIPVGRELIKSFRLIALIYKILNFPVLVNKVVLLLMGLTQLVISHDFPLYIL